MAKKKSKKGGQQNKISPERYIREKARTLPIGKCYIAPPDWQEAGMTNVIVTRVRPSGNLVMASFLVDTFCLGVKDASYNDNITFSDFEYYLNEGLSRMDCEEISYDEAHNLIYGAVAFAEEVGISPHRDFHTACYVLEEDTDDIPLIEYEYGKDGKYLLVVGPDRKEMRYMGILKRNLGDGFNFIMPYGEEVDFDFDGETYDDENDDEMWEDEFDPMTEITSDTLLKAMNNMHKMFEESSRNPLEVYSYNYPDYPQDLSVNNKFIADALLSAENYDSLPREVIEQILAMDPDEAAQDISNVVSYVIGRTYQAINDGTIGQATDSAIMHALVLFAQLQSEKALDAVLEIMRQNAEFSDYHLGDFAHELIYPALYACGKNKVDAIERYLNEPGLYTYLRAQAGAALAMIIIRHPQRRSEIIEVFRRLLMSMVTRLPKQEACDATFAGLLMSDLMDVKARELIPEIQSVFTTDCVDKSISGNCKTVVREIESQHSTIDKDRYTIPDIYQQYDQITKFLSQN